MTDLFTPLVTFLLGGIVTSLCFIYYIFKSKDDSFDQAFDEEAKKVLSNLKEEDKAKPKPKASKVKNDGSQKPKKVVSSVSQLVDRLNNSDLEPECSAFLAAHLEKLNSQVSSLTEARDAANDARTTTSNRIEEHKTARVTAETKLAMMKQEINDLNKKLKEVSSSEQRLNDSVSSLTKQNTDLVEGAVRSKEVLAKLKTAESALTLRIRDMEYALEKANTAVEDLSEDLSREVADHHTTKQELDHLRTEIKELSAAVSNADTRAGSAVEAARKEHEELLKKTEEENNARHAEDERLLGELAINKKLIDELNEQIKQFANTRQQLATAETDLKDCKKIMEDLGSLIKIKDQEVLKLQFEKGEMHKHICDLEKEVATRKELVVVETINTAVLSPTQESGEITSLTAENQRLSEKNQELRVRNLKVLADFASMNDQMAVLSKTLESQESALHNETDRFKRLVVEVLSSVAPEPLDDLENDKFSSWLSSIASSAACTSVGAAGDATISIAMAENAEKTKALIEVKDALDRLEKLLKEERRRHKEEVLALRSQLCKLQLSSLSTLKERVLELTAERENIDSLHSSVSEAISSLQ